MRSKVCEVEGPLRSAIRQQRTLTDDEVRIVDGQIIFNDLLAACKHALTAYEPIVIGELQGVTIRGQAHMNIPGVLRAAIAKAEEYAKGS